MPDEMGSRLAALVKQGRGLVDDLEGQPDDAWVDDAELTLYESWLSAVGATLLDLGGGGLEPFRDFRRILVAQRNPVGLKTHVVRRTFDLVFRMLEQHNQGALRRIEDIVVATVYDDFLDEAERLRAAGRLGEGRALACTVLGHALRRIGARRAPGALTGGTHSQLVSVLLDAGILDPADGLALQTRARACDAPGTEPLDAECGALIEQTRRLLAAQL